MYVCIYIYIHIYVYPDTQDDWEIWVWAIFPFFLQQLCRDVRCCPRLSEVGQEKEDLQAPKDQQLPMWGLSFSVVFPGSTPMGQHQEHPTEHFFGKDLAWIRVIPQRSLVFFCHVWLVLQTSLWSASVCHPKVWKTWTIGPVRAPAFARHRRKCGASSTKVVGLKMVGISQHITFFNKTIQNMWDPFSNIMDGCEKLCTSFFATVVKHPMIDRFFFWGFLPQPMIWSAQQGSILPRCRISTHPPAPTVFLRCLPGAWRSATPGAGTGSSERGGDLTSNCGIRNMGKKWPGNWVCWCLFSCLEEGTWWFIRRFRGTEPMYFLKVLGLKDGIDSQ